jgi:ABC-type bacteriocin/lantibiotic exporter with double-glycine peptidase domain
MQVKPPLITQERPDSCAIACLRMILGFHDRFFSERELIELAAMEEGGLDIEDLARLGRNLGLNAEVQELEVAGIAALVSRGVFPIVYLNRVHLGRRFPVSRRIALRLFLPHAVVPVGISHHFVTIHDPLFGKPRRVSKRKFEASQRDLRNWCVVCWWPASL